MGAGKFASRERSGDSSGAGHPFWTMGAVVIKRFVAHKHERWGRRGDSGGPRSAYCKLDVTE